jgi:hypothetical protein
MALSSSVNHLNDQTEPSKMSAVSGPSNRTDLEKHLFNKHPTAFATHGALTNMLNDYGVPNNLRTGSTQSNDFIPRNYAQTLVPRGFARAWEQVPTFNLSPFQRKSGAALVLQQFALAIEPSQLARVADQHESLPADFGNPQHD